MENKKPIKNSCNGSRGCRIYILPNDRKLNPIYSKIKMKR